MIEAPPLTKHLQGGRCAFLHQAAGRGAGELPRVVHRHVVHHQRVGQLQAAPQLLLVGGPACGRGLM